jgi:hypothetical protein
MVPNKNLQQKQVHPLPQEICALWKRLLVGLISTVPIFCLPACKHTSADFAYEAQRDVGKNSYTPRMQKDVKELINLVYKPF